jgi:hypothetical protein
MQVISSLHPFQPKRKTFTLTDSMTLHDIAVLAGADDWFFEEGRIEVCGKAWPRELWPYVKAKPFTTIELKVVVHGGFFKKIGLLLATVALVAATGFIGAGGLASLGFGSAFAAGSLGASLASAAVGIGGQLLLKALTPSPTVQGSEANARQELSQAGISGNPLQRGDVLPCLVGKFRYSPPQIIPPYTALKKGVIWAHAMYGLNGRNLIEDVLMNGVSIDSIPGVEYEVREGSGAEEDTFLSDSYRIPDTSQTELSTFKLVIDKSDGRYLDNQSVPSESAPKWHPYRMKADADEFHIRLLFDGPIMDQAAAGHSVPFRLRFRKVGDVSYRNGPEIHIHDLRLAGGFRQEFKIVRGIPRGGQWTARNDKFTAHVALKKSIYGATIWEADSYFVQSAFPATIVPVLTGYTGSGVTVSASSEFGAGTEAWKAFDFSPLATYWQPTADSLPAWIKVDHGTGVTATLRSFALRYVAATSNARDGYLEGSNDDSTWTRIATFDTFGGQGDYVAQCEVIQAFRYHRLTVSSNCGAASELFRLYGLFLSEENAVGQAKDASDNISVPLAEMARYVTLDEDGATIYLDPDDWDEGDYDIEVMRGWAYLQSQVSFDVSGVQTDRFRYNGTDDNFGFFDYKLETPKGAVSVYTIDLSQNKINSKCFVEVVTQVFNTRPIRADIEARLTRIAVKVPGLQVDSVSALFTGYAREWDGFGWESTPVPTQNPAAWYRDALLLAQKFAEPLPGEVISEHSLETFFEHCDAKGYSCNAVFQGRSMLEVLRVIASCGFASTRQSSVYGVVIDRDRSLDDPVGIITPQNSRDLGTYVTYENVPHGLLVSYADEDDDYRIKEVTVYREGYDSTNATDVQSPETYYGLTTEARAIERATYDLGQLVKRNIEYRREMELEALTYDRGDLVILADEVVARDSYYALIKEVLTSGGNVTGLVLYSICRMSESADSVLSSPDILDVTDLDAPQDFGIAIKQRDSVVFTAAINEQADTDTVTFSTPVADTGQFMVDYPVAIGPLGNEAKKVIVRNLEQSGEGRYTLYLIPMANEIIPT